MKRDGTISDKTQIVLAFFCLLLVVVSPGAFAMEGSQVRHQVSFARAANQYVHIESTFPVEQGRVEFAMPVWTPGSYLVREYSAHLEQLVVSASSGDLLASRKIAKNRWVAEVNEAGEITLAYDIWAGELNVGANWVDSSLALLNGAGVFLYTDASRSLPQMVEVNLPADWPNVHTSMDREGDGNRFIARDYDELVDSPIVAGKTVEYHFEVDGQAYGLVQSRENRFWDGARAVEDAAKIIKTQQAFWGINPFTKRYLFLNLFVGSHSGLEHDHSTVLMTDPWVMRDDHDYRRWLGLVSHEFFHAWNVRRMRPAALSEYDYEQESYIRELWLAEGLTSYYDNLLLFRSGLIDVPDYLESLAREIRNYETTPGREVRSAELASFDTWIKHYRTDENTINSTVSYYRKGAVIGFVTDTAIRRATDSDASLDTVMRRMFLRYGTRQNGGYPPGAFEQIVEEVAGQEVRVMVEEMIRETSDPDVDSALEWYGLGIDRNPSFNGSGPPLAGLGIEVGREGSALLVEQVVAGYSGAEAGLLPGDELIAIDGNRVNASNYDKLLARLRPEEGVELTLARHGRLLTVRAELREAIPAIYTIAPLDRIRTRQKSRLEQWLGRELVFK
ncbi:MAG: PDZ domain-containing protein [Xanthomonadales bacterium]|nr:PDZ domain-containing protein [Xanthomonadales bacterium]